MAINFANLVLRPARSTFGIRVLFDPVRSQPGKRPYYNKAIYASVDVDVQALDGSLVGDQRTTLGIRLADYEVPPMQEDRCVVPVPGLGETHYWIADVDLDGQGGAKLLLRLRPDGELSPDLPLPTDNALPGGDGDNYVWNGIPDNDS